MVLALLKQYCTCNAYAILKAMKKGGPLTESWGFTLVETMIVLAVSGTILTTALVLVNGRQDRTRFSVAIAQVQLDIQKYINEVSNGYFPDSQKFTCIATPSQITINASGTGQGQNKDCVFVGKAVQFGEGSTTDTVTTFPVAGRRLAPSGSEVTNIAEANIRSIALGNGTNVNLSVKSTLDAGMTIDDMWTGSKNNRSDKASALGLFTNLASYEVDNSSLRSGQLMVELYQVDGTKVGDSMLTDAVEAVDDGDVTKINQAYICIASGTTDQSGLITIGGANGAELSVTTEIFSGKTC